MSEPNKRRYFRPRFTLAVLLILVTAVSLPLAHVGQRRAGNQKRKAAVESLIAKGASLWPDVPTEVGAMPHPTGLRLPQTPVTIGNPNFRMMFPQLWKLC
jgi:hypothetical protein